MTRVQRRYFLFATGVLVTAPFSAKAQQAAKIPRIGFLAGDLAGAPHLPEAFRQGLRDLGYVDGRNISIDYRDAEGKLDRLPKLATELVALNVDVIVAVATLHVSAAKQATTTIPIVFVAVGDPLGEGLVTSLARPGGNLTGLSTLATELTGKRLELLKQVAPGYNRAAVLWQPSSLAERTAKQMVKEAEAAARALGTEVQFIEVRSPGDLERAFSEVGRARADALTTLPSTMLLIERQRIVDLAARNRLPAVYGSVQFVDAGGLMSYGPSEADLYRRAATYVDKILNGAKPGDLPVEQPAKFDLVINVKSAKALGLIVPPSLLTRADRLIQ